MPALAAALVVALLAACGGSSTTVAKLPPLAPGRAGPQSMFTMGSQLIEDPVGTLNQLHALGVDRVHVYMSWSAIAPDAQSATRPSFDATDPAAYPASGWAAYDTVVRGLAARHMGIDLALAGPVPVWAESPGSKYDRKEFDYKPDAAAYGQWVRAVATRYSGHYTPPGGKFAAAAGQLLVDLERAEPRDLPGAGDGQRPLLGRGRAAAVSRSGRRGLERAARHRPRLGHDPDRRDGSRRARASRAR